MERDLERTSKQLQMEIGVLQHRNPEALTEPLLAEIDTMFQEAESYFKNKQELLHQRQITFRQQRGAMNQAKSKVNTNLPQRTDDSHHAGATAGEAAGADFEEKMQSPSIQAKLRRLNPPS